jgi:two-component system LytT family response regulator
VTSPRPDSRAPGDRIAHRLRVLIVDDERPARAFLKAMLAPYDDVEIVGEAADGADAITQIEQLAPDLVLMDLHMPEIDGLAVVRLLRRDCASLIAFVTAYDQHAVEAFELNAIDYLLKPVEPARLRNTVNRAIERLEHADFASIAVRESERVRAVADAFGDPAVVTPLQRVPVRRAEDTIFVRVDDISTVVADGELLRLTTVNNDRHVITYRLKDLEARLPKGQFIRLSRGALASIARITSVSPMPGGTYSVLMSNGQRVDVSRIRSRVIRNQLLKL